MKINPLSSALIALTLLFQFCSDNGPVDSESETDKEITASEIIGSSGGSVKTENGITLTIPQCAKLHTLFSPKILILGVPSS